MPVLAIESATDLAGVALADETGVLAGATVGRGRRHGESIAPAVQFVCARAGVSLDALDAVAVDVGPGLFTGLRVGVATAKALAFALGLPVVTATSLELLARGAARAACAPDADDVLLVSVVDARRGELFWAPFSIDPAGVTRVGEESLDEPGRLVARLEELASTGRRCLCLGDGARRYAAELAAVPGVSVAGPAWDHPDAGALALLGIERLAAGLGREAAGVEAHYLRDADVRIHWEQRVAPRPGA